MFNFTDGPQVWDFENHGQVWMLIFHNHAAAFMYLLLQTGTTSRCFKDICIIDCAIKEEFIVFSFKQTMIWM